MTETTSEYPEKTGRMRSVIAICALLVAVTVFVYWQVGSHQFVDWDDTIYVSQNPHVRTGITGPNILWAFTSIEATNWHPVTWLSHMADIQLFGLNPRWHHLTNVALHAASAVLLFLLLFRLTRALWQSSFVAALFALHPLHVESVAWVAERKDVLSALFYFLSLAFYAAYAEKRQPASYCAALTAFMLGLMSKPMLVSLPLVMLMLDFWPLQRFHFDGSQAGRRYFSGFVAQLKVLALEKIPFFICSLLSSAMTIYAQQKGGAITDLGAAPLGLRLENAITAYAAYVAKTIWPHDMAVLYPFPSHISLWQVFGSLLMLLLMSLAAIRGGRRAPFLIVGWCWFLVTLVPVIGLVKVGSQAMADRYHYIPSVGLFIMAAWGSPRLVKGLPYRQWLVGVLYLAVISASAVVSWQQLGYWRDSRALYRHTLEVTSGNILIHYNFGNFLAGKGELEAAIGEYRAALAINSGYVKARFNLANALSQKGELDAALDAYRAVLALQPTHLKAHNNLGQIWAEKGDLDAAIREFQAASRINPNDAVVRDNLATALALRNGR